jgi:uncharacterized protein YcbX
MHVAEIWRYPVKSMAGERIPTATITREGIVGDRVVQVQDARGLTITARTHPGLLAFRATVGPEAETLVNGVPYTAPEIAEAVRRVVGAGAGLVRDESTDRFDVLPLLVATDGAISQLGVDRRRFRPNILVGGVEGLAERAWPGRQMRIGTAVVGFKRLRGRCVMITWDPDTLEQDPSVLERIIAELGGRLALDTFVVEEGRVAVGDPVELLGRGSVRGA